MSRRIRRANSIRIMKSLTSAMWQNVAVGLKCSRVGSIMYREMGGQKKREFVVLKVAGGGAMVSFVIGGMSLSAVQRDKI